MAGSGDAVIPNLSEGEELLVAHDAVMQAGGSSYAGLLSITSQRLIFRSKVAADDGSQPEAWDVSLDAVSKARALPAGGGGGIEFYTNGNLIRVFPSEGGADAILRALQTARSSRAKSNPSDSSSELTEIYGKRRLRAQSGGKRRWPWWAYAAATCGVVGFLALNDTTSAIFGSGARPDVGESAASMEDRDPESSAPPDEPTVAADKTPSHTVVDTEDLSYGRVTRTSVRVVVDEPLGEVELRQLAMSIIEDLKQKRARNAVALLFYRPGTDTSGRFTLGKVEWAPGGEWSRAGDVQAGDYSKHWTSLEMADAPKVPEHLKGLPEAKRRKIFRSLIRLQDRGVETDESYRRTAKRYEVSVSTVYSIATEGVESGWPMP